MIKTIIGAVDIGGTKIHVGLVSTFGKILSQEKFPTQTGDVGAELSLTLILNSLNQQCSEQYIRIQDLLGIGIVCAGPIDPKLGTVENPYTLGWSNFPIIERIINLTGVTAYLENDANGALLGEISHRQFENENVLMVTFGTGIGVSVYSQQQLHGTHSRFHPEMGHLIVSNEGPECYCHHQGCFESLCSGSALNKRAQEHGFTDFDAFYQSWHKGNNLLNPVMKTIHKQLTNGMWNLITIFKPNKVILGGGFMSHYYSHFSPIIQSTILGLEDFVGKVELIQANTKDQTALLGAATIVKNKLEVNHEKI